MRQSTAAVGSAAFFVVAPGTVVGLIPWLITRWQVSGSLWMIAVGAALIIAGLMPLALAFVEFAKAGGTPMPLAPTERLVVGGFNRYVRNPMYVGLLVAILGQAWLFGSVGLLVYAAAVWVMTASFVRWYEEPTVAVECAGVAQVVGSRVIAHAALPSWGFPWRYPLPAWLVLLEFPSGSFFVAPQLGEDVPRWTCAASAARFAAAFRSRSARCPHESQSNTRSMRRSLVFTTPQLEQVFELGYQRSATMRAVPRQRVL